MSLDSEVRLSTLFQKFANVFDDVGQRRARGALWARTLGSAPAGRREALPHKYAI